MTDNTEINDIEQIQEEGTDTSIQEETLNNEPVIEELEPVPNPWDNAPTDVYFYEKIYEDGHLGSFTQSAELAYKSGWDIEHNYISIEDTQQSDINGWTYRKELCPMKTEEEKQKELAEQRFKDIQTAVQAALDGKAKEKNYDNGFALAGYALSTNDTFRSEAGKFIAWRDAVWARCYQILDAYKAGEIEMPSVENVLAVLPELEWDDE